MKKLERKLRELRLRQPSAGYAERVLAQVPEASEELTSRADQELAPNIRKMTMKSRTAKLAVAAVILIGALVGVIYLSPSDEAEPRIRPSASDSPGKLFPPELLQMPVEELLDIHFGKTQSTFGSGLIAAAVQIALDKLSAGEILAIGEKYADKRDRISACYAATLPPSLSEMVEACDFIVQARAEEVDLDVSDIKAAILAKQRNQLSIWSGAPVKATVQLTIVESYPKLPSHLAEQIRFQPVFNSKRVDLLEEGKEYLIALNNHEDLFWLLRWNHGVYVIDPNRAMVANLRNGPTSLDDTWEFIMDSYDAIHEGTLPSGKVLDYWLEKLQSDNITDCLTAVEYFNTLAEPIAPQELVMGAMERFLAGQIPCSEQNSEPIDGIGSFELAAGTAAGLRQKCFVSETLDLLIQVADGPTAERMLLLYEENMSSSESILSEGNYIDDIFPRVVRQALKNRDTLGDEPILSLFSMKKPGEDKPAWIARPESVFEALRNASGKDTDQLLLDMLEDPAAFQIPDTDRLQLLWHALASRAQPEIAEYLEQFLADPENTDLGVPHDNDIKATIGRARDALRVFHANQKRQTMSREQAIQHAIEQYRNGIVEMDSVVQTMIELLEPDDKQFVPFLSEAIISDWWKAPILAAEVLPDPCLVPALKKALEREEPGRGMLLQALFACGEQEDSIEMALAFIQEFFSEKDETTSRPYYHHFDIRDIVRFLGTTGDESVLSSIEHLTREDVIAAYRETVRTWHANQLQQAAVLALGRLGSEAAIPRLEEIYQSQETEISVKIAAALSLYCLGDDQGLPLLEYFVTDTERSLPEVEMVTYYGKDRAPKFFQRPILYLNSPRTDALLLESFRHRVFPYDEGYTGDVRCYYGRVFIKKYETQILPLLVDQLSNRDRDTRENANALLKRLTGQDFSFEPGKFVLQQAEVIDRWRSYVDNYLRKR